LRRRIFVLVVPETTPLDGSLLFVYRNVEDLLGADQQCHVQFENVGSASWTFFSGGELVLTLSRERVRRNRLGIKGL
jgi:hypothetical protein